MSTYKLLLFALGSLLLASCKKDWIELKSNKSIDVPSTVIDFQALLDNSQIMNEMRPPLGEVSADNYYTPGNLWATWGFLNRNAYVWEKEIYSNTNTDNFNWNYSYRQAFYANIVLDGLGKVPANELNTEDWKNAKGSAYFYRADAFFNVAQLYTKPYSMANASEPGIPLRLSPDPNDKSTRATLQASYEQILNDLHSSTAYLPNVPLSKTRPSKPAAYAMLARVYLVMQDYSKSLLYADSCLKMVDSLMDYNTSKTTNPNFPIPYLNKEVIYHATIGDELATANSFFVDSVLYRSYHNNDLRKTMFYKFAAGQATFIGTYTGGVSAPGTSRAFGGIATDEVYLTRAESYARTGKWQEGLDDLNTLIRTRFITNTFVPFTATNATEALALILQERRKETPFRGLRWTDLRRLNVEGANIVLKRVVNGKEYELQANDPRYTLPLPPDVISLSGMEQNVR